MLQKLAEQVEEIRRRIDEPVAAKISNNYIIRVLYEAHTRVARELYEPTDDLTLLSSTANVPSYPLPSDFIAPTDLIWQFDVSHYALGLWDKKQILDQIPQAGDPSNYAIDEASKTFMVYPTPSTTATTTTVVGSLSASATTIPVVTTVGFGGIGWIKIDNEIIQYQQADSTDFLQCTRGACNTLATTHSNGATVTWGDLMFFYTRLPKMNKNLGTTNVVTVTNGSTAVVGVGTNWLSGQNIYAGDYIGIGSMSTTQNSETFPLVWYKIASVGSATSITLETAYAEVSGSSVNAIISSQTEMYEQDCPVVIRWAEYIIKGIMDNPDGAETARLGYNSELALAKERRNGPDKLNVIKSTKWSRRNAGIAVRPPPHFESWNNG